jgi:hypothetical protein
MADEPEFDLDDGQIRALQQFDRLRTANWPVTAETLRTRLGDTPDAATTLAYFEEQGLAEWMVYPQLRTQTYELTDLGRAALEWAGSPERDQSGDS